MRNKRVFNIYETSASTPAYAEEDNKVSPPIIVNRDIFSLGIKPPQ
jgi:hypothetical protein